MPKALTTPTAECDGDMPVWGYSNPSLRIGRQRINQRDVLVMRSQGPTEAVSAGWENRVLKMQAFCLLCSKAWRVEKNGIMCNSMRNLEVCLRFIWTNQNEREIDAHGNPKDLVF